LSILKKFACDIEKFTLIYGLFPSDAFVLNTKSGIMTNLMTVSAFDIYKREVFDIFKVVENNSLFLHLPLVDIFAIFLFSVYFSCLANCCLIGIIFR
jgi:hypothetical protein